VGSFVISPLKTEAGGDKTMDMVNNIHWLGQAAVKVTAGGKVIYFDPYQIKEPDQAHIILISHSHQDHLSKGDISKVTTENTVIIAPKSCESDLASIKKAKLLLSEPGFKETVEGITIEAVPAYNVDKTNFHPKKNNWVGYIITVDGVRIYHAGDTERIPEMKTFSCDIAMLPLGQTYTMNSVEDAAEAALDVKAKVAIPIHFAMYEGTKEDADKFKKLLEGKVKVVIK
jgi:L-ascorbate metabolism protein UlaG (beta-lactamase superfamily)